MIVVGLMQAWCLKICTIQIMSAYVKPPPPPFICVYLQLFIFVCTYVSCILMSCVQSEKGWTEMNYIYCTYLCTQNLVRLRVRGNPGNNYYRSRDKVTRNFRQFIYAHLLTLVVVHLRLSNVICMWETKQIISLNTMVHAIKYVDR